MEMFWKSYLGVWSGAVRELQRFHLDVLNWVERKEIEKSVWVRIKDKRILFCKVVSQQILEPRIG